MVSAACDLLGYAKINRKASPNQKSCQKSPDNALQKAAKKSVEGVFHNSKAPCEIIAGRFYFTAFTC
jgi:hypothetical protein